jgi:hypothetical protein
MVGTAGEGAAASVFLQKRKQAQKAISVLTQSLGGRDGLANLRIVFDEIDLDGSGELDADEFTAAMRGCFGDSMSQADIDDTMELVDTSGDGEVSFEEFEAFAKAELEMDGLFADTGDDGEGAGGADAEEYEAAKQAAIMAMHTGAALGQHWCHCDR